MLITIKPSQHKMSDYHCYVVDFFNIFSDFREIKYKKLGIDFHTCKYERIRDDTMEFFDVFFTKYIKKVGIDINESEFIFVMKKLHGYSNFLSDVLQKYNDVNFQFAIIEEKYDNYLVDKNKDDFVCQYLLYSIGKKYNCSLISNDRYRDRSKYIDLFNFELSIVGMSKDDLDQVTTQKMRMRISNINYVKQNLMSQELKRCSIPKHNLFTIL